MPTKDEIFSHPVNIPRLLTNQPPIACVGSLFTNFMYYAKRHWSYVASASVGGEELLNGNATQAPCGGIATALKILINERLHLTVESITISGYVWTKPSFLSFDAKIKGNVSKAESPNLYNEGCLFNEHYFIKCGTKYYDPCLNSIYTNQDEAVRKQYTSNEVVSKGNVMAGLDANSMLVFRPGVIVPGWQRGAWLIVAEQDVLRYVTDKNDLMYISTKRKTGNLALAARKASRKEFEKAGRVNFWIEQHRIAGITV